MKKKEEIETLFEGAKNEDIDKKVNRFPICEKCDNLIIIKNISLSCDYELKIHFECGCPNRRTIPFQYYYDTLQYYYNTIKNKCSCTKHYGMSYCLICSKYLCINCYHKHPTFHFLTKRKINNYIRICKCINTTSFFFCKMCNVIFCKKCFPKKHVNHQVISINKYYEETKVIYNKKSIDKKINSLLLTVTEKRRNNVNKELKMLFSLYNDSFIKSKTYPHLAIIESINNMMTITSLHKERIKYLKKFKFPIKEIATKEAFISEENISNYFYPFVLDNKKLVIIFCTNGSKYSCMKIYSKYFRYEEESIFLSMYVCEAVKINNNEIVLTGKNKIEIWNFNSKPKRVVELEHSMFFDMILQLNEEYVLFTNRFQTSLFNRNSLKFTEFNCFNCLINFYRIDNNQFLVHYYENKIHIFDSHTIKEKKVINISEEFINSNFSVGVFFEIKNGGLLMSGSTKQRPFKIGYLCYFNKENFQITKILSGLHSYYYFLVTQIDKESLLCASRFNFFDVVDIESGLVTQKYNHFCFHNENFFCENFIVDKLNRHLLFVHNMFFPFGIINLPD